MFILFSSLLAFFWPCVKSQYLPRFWIFISFTARIYRKIWWLFYSIEICRILWKKSAPQEVQDLSGYESSNTFARRILNRFPNRETVDCQNFAAKLLPFSPEIPTDPSSPPFLLPRNLQIFLSLDRRPSFFHPKFRHCRVSRKAHLENLLPPQLLHKMCDDRFFSPPWSVEIALSFHFRCKSIFIWWGFVSHLSTPSPQIHTILCSFFPRRRIEMWGEKDNIATDFHAPARILCVAPDRCFDISNMDTTTSSPSKITEISFFERS